MLNCVQAVKVDASSKYHQKPYAAAAAALTPCGRCCQHSSDLCLGVLKLRLHCAILSCCSAGCVLPLLHCRLVISVAI